MNCVVRQRYPRRVTAFAGFSLLEVLTAFTILALVLGAVFQVVVSGLRAAGAGEEYTRGALHAQSKLAELSARERLIEGVEEGSFDEKYAWRATFVPYRFEGDPAGTLEVDELAVRPLTVTVEVFWDGARRRRAVTLTTLQLAPR